MPGTPAEFNFQMSRATRAANRVFRICGYADRVSMARDIRHLAAALPEQDLRALLNQQNILRRSYRETGDLLRIQPENIRLRRTEETFTRVIAGAAQRVTDNFTRLEEVPESMLQIPSLARAIVGLNLASQGAGVHAQEITQLTVKLGAELRKADFTLTDEFKAQAADLSARLKDLAQTIPDQDIQGLILEITKGFDRLAGGESPEAVKLDIHARMGELAELLAHLQNPREADSPSKLLKYLPYLGQLTSLALIAEMINLYSSNVKYFLVERSFFWAAFLALVNYSQLGRNFLDIISKSQSIPPLQFSQEEIKYKNLPAVITKRFSNEGFFGGLDCLVQDLFIDLVTGNHNVLMNNDSSQAYFATTWGDFQTMRRMEKRYAKLNGLIGRLFPRSLSSFMAKKLALTLSVFDKKMPSHYSFIETAGEAGFYIGKTLRIMHQLGERGGEYACYDALRRIIEEKVPEARPLINNQQGLLYVIDRLGVDVTLSSELDNIIQERGETLRLSQPVIDRLKNEINTLKAAYVRESLINGAIKSGVEATRAQGWADQYLTRINSESRLTEISKLGQQILYRTIEPGRAFRELTPLLRDEFGLSSGETARLVKELYKKDVEIERNARALNKDFELPLELIGKFRDFAMVNRFQERTGDQRKHEEANATKIYRVLRDRALKGTLTPSYFLDLVDSAARADKKLVEAAEKAGVTPSDRFIENDSRKGSFTERLQVSLSAKGISTDQAVELADQVTTFMASRYLDADAWVKKIQEKGKTNWWEADWMLFEEYLDAAKAELERVAGTQGISGELTKRAEDVLEEALRLEKGLHDRHMEGFISLSCGDIEGVKSISPHLNSIPQFKDIQTRLRSQSQTSENIKTQLDAILGADSKPVLDAVKFLTDKGIGKLRSEKRMPDGNFLSYTSIKAQAPEILFGEDTLHRTMRPNASRFEDKDFQSLDIVLLDEATNKESLVRTAQEQLASVREGSPPYFEIKELIVQYVGMLEAKGKIHFEIQDILRSESRPLEERDRTVDEIRQILSSRPDRREELEIHWRIKQREAQIKSGGLTEAQEETALREVRALRSQLYNRERVQEATLDAFAEVTAEELTNPTTGVAARAADIVERMQLKESKGYGMGSNNSGKALLGELKKLAQTAVEQDVRRISPTEKNDELWGSIFFYERMNREKWGGVKADNNDSGLGFYAGERIGVKAASLVENLRERVNIPPQIQAEIYREFCREVKLSEDFTEDQRLKKELKLMPRQIAERIVDQVLLGTGSEEAVGEILRTTGIPINATIPVKAIDKLKEIASEILIRTLAPYFVGAAVAQERCSPEERANRHLLPERAQIYLQWAFTAAGEKINLKARINETHLTAAEKSALKDEVENVRRRLRADEKIKQEIRDWYQERMGWEENRPERMRNALYEEYQTRLDRKSLFKPELHWSLYPAVYEPLTQGDRDKQLVGEWLQQRRREFILVNRTAAETAAFQLSLSNMPRQKIENGVYMEYGEALLKIAREIDAYLIQHPEARRLPYRELLEAVSRHLDQREAESHGQIVNYLNTNRFERSIESEMDAVRDLDTDNHIFLSAQKRCSSYWEKDDEGRLVRSYSAVLQSQQFYPESQDRFLAAQNDMSTTYSTNMGRLFGHRGKQVIMGCFVVKNRRALDEAVEWVEIPKIERQEERMFSDYFNQMDPNKKEVWLGRYMKGKLSTEILLTLGLLGAGALAGFSGWGLAAVGASAAVPALTTLMASGNVKRAIALGLLGGTVGLVVTTIAAGLSTALIPLLAGAGLGFLGGKIALWLQKSGNSTHRKVGLALGAAYVPMAAAFLGPFAGLSAIFGLAHTDDLRYASFRISYDTREKIAHFFGIKKTGIIGSRLLERQRLTRMYEEEEAYNQPNDVEDFGTSLFVFRRGFHSDFHESIDGLSGDVRDMLTLGIQRGRWHGGMMANFIPALKAYILERQMMPDADWLRYINQTLGPVGSMSRLFLNINFWSFIAMGTMAFKFGSTPQEIFRNLLIFNAICIPNYLAFILPFRAARIRAGSTWSKVSDMTGVLDTLSPINVGHAGMRIRFGYAPPFVVTKTPYERVSNPSGGSSRIGTVLSWIWPWWPMQVRYSPDPTPVYNMRPFRWMYGNLHDPNKYKNNFQRAIFSKYDIIDQVTQSKRTIWAYALATLGVGAMMIPGLIVQQPEAYLSPSLLFWLALLLNYPIKGIRIVGEGVPPLGTYQQILNGELRSAETPSQADRRRLSSLRRGLKKSAF